MNLRDAQARRPAVARKRQLRAARARIMALGSLIAAAVVAAVIVFGSAGGSGSHARSAAGKAAIGPRGARTSASTASAKPGTAAVPILTYHVINVPPPQSGASQDLYVPANEFSAQMDALKAGGWHAVTLNELQAYWTRGASLGTGKPIVITFDGGFASQYTNALPVLKRLGWVGVVNVEASGLSPADGGATDAQVRDLIAAGWELDAEGSSQSDLTALAPSQLQSELSSDRQTLRTRYNVAVNWLSYPSGRYNAAVTAAARAAGFLGATTLASGWASPQSDRFRLPRLQVVGGTSPAALMSQIMAAQQATSAPTASAGV